MNFFLSAPLVHTVEGIALPAGSVGAMNPSAVWANMIKVLIIEIIFC
jgi:hypothetical protein